MAPRTAKLDLGARARSFGYAINGIAHVVRTQANAWIHAFATACVVAAGLAFDVSSEEWRWIVLAMALVWSAEAMNTAVETLTDLASPQRHALAGKAKDAAAGAVLIAAIGAACIGVSVFWPHLRR